MGLSAPHTKEYSAVCLTDSYLQHHMASFKRQRSTLLHGSLLGSTDRFWAEEVLRVGSVFSLLPYLQDRPRDSTTEYSATEPPLHRQPSIHSLAVEGLVASHLRHVLGSECLSCPLTRFVDHFNYQLRDLPASPSAVQGLKA